MREIKFRGKLINGGKWAEGNLQISIKGTMIITPDETILGTYGQVDKNTVGQYVGLKDKNGVEIYEGDIVQVTWADADIGVVIYEYNGFVIDVTNLDKPYGRVALLNTHVRVIGNIYDNPELLKGGQE